MHHSEQLLVDNNLHGIFGLFSKWGQADVVQNNDYFATLTNIDSLLFNGLFSKRNTNLATLDINEIVEHSNKTLSSLLYWESGLANTNAEKLDNFTLIETSPAMFLSKDKLVKPSPFNQSVIVKTVNTSEELNKFCQLLKAGYDLSDNEQLAFYDFYQAIGFDSELVHYLAYVDGEAVGTVSTYINDGVTGIYNVSTIHEKRKQGVASAIMFQVLNKCFSKHKYSVLISSELGFSVYRSLGFEIVGQYKQYVYELTDNSEDKQSAA